MRKILPVYFFVRRSAEFEDFGDFNRDVLTVRVVVWVNASYFRPATLLFGHPWVSFDIQRACEKNAACFRALGVMVMELFQFFNFRRVWCFSRSNDAAQFLSQSASAYWPRVWLVACRGVPEIRAILKSPKVE